MWDGRPHVDEPTTDRAQPVASLRSFGLLAQLVGALALAVTALLPIGTAVAPVASGRSQRPKVVIVSGPVGSFNRHYKADADALAARKYTKMSC